MSIYWTQVPDLNREPNPTLALTLASPTPNPDTLSRGKTI